jgi:nucleoside-diphosphate-sugar epimerase
MKIIVTGASGYVGGAILSALRQAGHDVQAWSRRRCPPPWHAFTLAEPPAADAWFGCDAIVHAAHDFTARDMPGQQLRNIAPSLALLESARSAGLRRLIFISSFSSFEGTRSTYGRAKHAIEKEWLTAEGTVIRPGLVWGDQAGGVMGSLERVVQSLPLVPCLTGPLGLPQYLVHEDDLGTIVLDAIQADSAAGARLIEAAHPHPVAFKRILALIARRHHLHRAFLPVPWQLAMAAIKTAESFGLNPPFRSDSLTGLVHGNPHPQITTPPAGILYRPFA